MSKRSADASLNARDRLGDASASARVLDSKRMSSERQNDDASSRTPTSAILFPAVRFAACALGTIGSLTVYGVLQERVMTLPYARDGVSNEDASATWRRVLRESTRFGALEWTRGEGANVGEGEGDVFTTTMFLVFMNRWMSMIVAGTLAAALGWGGRNRASSKDYATVSVSNLLSTLCQYEVLKYLSFSVSTLAKTMKVVPVMIWGYFLDGRKFILREYVEAFVVTLGCFLFVVNRGWESKVEREFEMQSDLGVEAARQWSMKVGIFILLMYFVCDGFTSSYQQTMYRRDRVTVTAQVFFTSLFTTMFSFVWIVCTNQLTVALRFVYEHSAISRDIFILSVASTVAQFSIAYTIKAYSAVVLASLMTARQVISVLLSCYLFGEPLTLTQWTAVALIVLPFIGKRVAPSDVVHSIDRSSSPFQRSPDRKVSDVDHLLDV